jgi:hypothetical protein
VSSDENAAWPQGHRLEKRDPYSQISSLITACGYAVRRSPTFARFRGESPYGELIPVQNIACETRSQAWLFEGLAHFFGVFHSNHSTEFADCYEKTVCDDFDGYAVVAAASR